MKRIYKYDVPSTGEFEISAPLGFTPLTVQLQNSMPVLWAIVDPATKWTTHTFRLVATGEEFDDAPYRYVGTFQPTTILVFHLLMRVTQ